MVITAAFATLTVLLLLIAPYRWAALLANRLEPETDHASRLLSLLLGYYVVHSVWALLLGISHLFGFPFFLGSGVILWLTGRTLVTPEPGFPNLPARWWSPATENPLISAVFALLCGILAAKLLFLPSENYDSLMYHLPVIGVWLSNGALADFTQWFYISRYPFGWELVSSLWMIYPGSDALVLVPSFIAWIMFLIALYLLAREAGAASEASAMSALIAASSPIVLNSLHAIHVDVPLAAAFTSILYFSIRYVRRSEAAALLAMLFAAAMLCSLKMSGPAYCLVAVLPALLLDAATAVRERRWPRAFRAAFDHLHALTGGVAVLLLVGGFWYFRNWILWGNPLGFVEVKLAGVTVFPVLGEVEPMVRDVRSGSLLRMFDTANPAHWNVVSQQVLLNFGLPIVIMAVALAVLSVLAVVYVSRGRFQFGILTLVILSMLAVTIYLYAASPFTADNGTQGGRITSWMGWQLRYGFPALVPLAVATALVLSRVPASISRLVACSALFLGAVFLAVDPAFFVRHHLRASTAPFGHQLWDYMTSRHAGALAALLACLMIVTAFALMFIAVSRMSLRKGTRRILLLSILLLLLVVIARVHKLEKSRRFGGIVEAVEQHVAPGQTVAYGTSHRSYLFFRTDWQNKVAYVPRASTRDQWLEQLDQAGAQWYAVGPLFSRPSQEYSWMEQLVSTGEAQRVYHGDMRKEPALYRLTPAPPAGVE